MRIALVVMAMLIAGCARGLTVSGGATPSETQASAVSARDAGCSSGLAAGGNPWHRFNKDTEQYITDARYKSDWDDGFALCKGRMDAVNSVPLR